jgi:hypothetical protein
MLSLVVSSIDRLFSPQRMDRTEGKPILSLPRESKISAGDFSDDDDEIMHEMKHGSHFMYPEQHHEYWDEPRQSIQTQSLSMSVSASPPGMIGDALKRVSDTIQSIVSNTADRVSAYHHGERWERHIVHEFEFQLACQVLYPGPAPHRSRRATNRRRHHIRLTSRPINNQSIHPYRSDCANSRKGIGVRNILFDHVPTIVIYDPP